MWRRIGLAALEVDRARSVIDSHDGPGRALRLRVANFLLRPESVVLSRKSISVYERPLLAPDDAFVCQSAQGFRILDELVIAHRQPLEVLPPRRFILAAVESEQLGENPAGLLLDGAMFRISRDTGGQQLCELGDFLEMIRQIFARLRIPRIGTGHFVFDLRGELIAQLLEPVAKSERRQAVVAVVAFDASQQLVPSLIIATKLQPRLKVGEGRVRGAQLDGPPEAVEGLELFDRIAFDGCPQGLPDYPVKIDEHFSTKEPVDLVFPGRVTAHEALHCRGLVRSEVVDVQIRIALEPLHHPIDELLEGLPFIGAIQRPSSRVLPRCVCQPEEVLDPVRKRVGICLDVEKKIARGGRGKRAKSLIRDDRLQELISRLACPAALDLDPCLITNLLQCGAMESIDGWATLKI